MELYRLTLHEAQDLLRTRKISSVELTRALLDRIQSIDGKLNAYLTINDDRALEAARLADMKIEQGADFGKQPLLGIPISVKDIICTRNTRTTAGSKILHNFIPPYNAAVVDKLEGAGAIVIGKTNCDEFAMGSSNENSAFGPVHNPWDLYRVPGGSSGGSAAAVAADEAFAALGTDTGGSVRQPASLTNIVGLRPTYGRVSRYGVIAFASSLDQVGPMTKDVRDAAILLRAIAGRDLKDSTTMDLPVPDYETALGRDSLKGLRVGVPAEYFGAGMQPGVESALRTALREFEKLGAELDQVSLPHTQYALPTYYLLAPAEASANLARYDGVKYGFRAEGGSMWEQMKNTREEGFGAEVRRRIILGTYALSAGYYDAYYLKAQKVRTLIKQDFDKAFEKFDVLLGAASPTTAFKLGEKTSDPLQMYLADVFTLAHPLAGICAMCLPCGFSDGLPVGIQVMGRAFDEERILQVGYAYEQVTQWHKRRPPI
ncbi:MAG TPA: Asp-tRNA(Asn)/Glu-tRNA(Gln) amidotransferase subunit GatA [Anaerolineae bacterium]